MSHFAKVRGNIVEEILVAEQEFVDSIPQEEGIRWIQTSYNTRGGIHYQPDSNVPSETQNKALRKNYAGIGFTYDDQRDAFIPPQPYPSWVIDEFSCLWNAPVPYPDDGKTYTWSETTLSWVELKFVRD